MCSFSTIAPTAPFTANTVAVRSQRVADPVIEWPVRLSGGQEHGLRYPHDFLKASRKKGTRIGLECKRS